MNTTTAQNAAHRNDIAWIKSTGRHFQANGETFISEHMNPWTGQAIRKDWRMTGRDWVIFDAAGNVTGRAHSLTWAKLDAEAAK
jgi:hypothetical protein